MEQNMKETMVQGIKYQVSINERSYFRRSISNSQRSAKLRNITMLLISLVYEYELKSANVELLRSISR